MWCSNCTHLLLKKSTPNSWQFMRCTWLEKLKCILRMKSDLQPNSRARDRHQVLLVSAANIESRSSEHQGRESRGSGNCRCHPFALRQWKKLCLYLDCFPVNLNIKRLYFRITKRQESKLCPTAHLPKNLDKGLKGFYVREESVNKYWKYCICLKGPWK